MKEELEAAQSSVASLGKVREEVAADELSEKARKVWGELDQEIGKALVRASMSKDLKALRAAYSDLSEVVIRLERHFGHPGGPLFEVHCPMALDWEGASWLQGTKTIENPYFGASMLRCGEVRQELPAVKAAEDDAKDEEASRHEQ